MQQQTLNGIIFSVAITAFTILFLFLLSWWEKRHPFVLRAPRREGQPAAAQPPPGARHAQPNRPLVPPAVRETMAAVRARNAASANTAATNAAAPPPPPAPPPCAPSGFHPRRDDPYEEAPPVPPAYGFGDLDQRPLEWRIEEVKQAIEGLNHTLLEILQAIRELKER